MIAELVIEFLDYLVSDLIGDVLLAGVRGLFRWAIRRETEEADGEG